MTTVTEGAGPVSERISGKPDASTLRLALLAARFNEFVTVRLVAGAREELLRHGARDGQITEIWVPGSWELPPAAQRAARSGRFGAIVALGCLIRGQTSHFDHIAACCARGLSQVSLETGVPIGFGVLTVETLEQAIDRAGGKYGNKGAEAARAAVEMAHLLGRLGADEPR